MRYPLELTFKLVAIAPQIYVRDSAGELLLYVRQKAFKLRESVTVYADEAQTRARYTIEADRVIDWNAKYEIRTADGTHVGTVQRQGMRSLWRTHYDVHGTDGAMLTLREANPWTKVADGLFGEIPVVGMLSGYLFHPAYVLNRADGTTLFRVQKRPALFEGRYTITQEGPATTPEEELGVLGAFMMLLLERSRG